MEEDENIEEEEAEVEQEEEEDTLTPAAQIQRLGACREALTALAGADLMSPEQRDLVLQYWKAEVTVNESNSK